MCKKDSFFKCTISVYDCLDIYIVSRNYNYDVQTRVEFDGLIM